MLRVAIIAPPYPLSEAPSPPLGLSYVAAAYEQAGCEVRIFDYIVRAYSPAKLEAEIKAFKPDIVGTGAVTMNFKKAASIFEHVKRVNPEILTIMGGPHVSFDYVNALNDYPMIDLIMRGEGEATIAELVDIINRRESWQDVAGLAFRGPDGQVVVTAERPLIEDLDTLPLPARHLLPLSRYQALGYSVSVITSRGCPNKCIFCLGRRMVGYKVRFRSIDRVLDEIEQLLSLGITRVNISDDLFTANRARCLKFCERVKERGIKFGWSAFSRVNTVDEELLNAMASAGCDSISFGVESGSEDMLKVARKGITTDQARRAVAACKASGMTAHASFIVGLPGESEETFAATRALAAELDIEHGYHFFSPFPGTTVLENLHEYDLEILTKDWDRYDANEPIVKTSKLEPQQMKDFVESCYQIHYDNERLMKQRIADGTATDQEKLRIFGEQRMNLIFDILSKDLIETHGVAKQFDDHLVLVSNRVAEATGNDQEFTRFTLDSLIKSGYVKTDVKGDQVNYFWTHNAKTVHYDLAHA